MENIAAVQFRSVYGNDVCYPANDAAKAFAALAGQKTLTHREFRSIRALGYKIIEVDRFGRSVGEVVDA